VNQQGIEAVLKGVVERQINCFNLFPQYPYLIHVTKAPVQEPHFIAFDIFGGGRGQNNPRKYAVEPVHQKELHRTLYIEEQNDPVLLRPILSIVDEGFIKDNGLTIPPRVLLAIYINITIVRIRRDQPEVIAQ